MRLLLDSNVLLWSITDRQKLTATVLALLADDANEFFVSRASLWELSIKLAKGKLQLPGSSIRPLLQQIEASPVTIIPIEDAHIIRTESLPHIHRDPFDRLLIAQALAEGLTILSSDETIPLYEVPVIWK